MVVKTANFPFDYLRYCTKLYWISGYCKHTIWNPNVDYTKENDRYGPFVGKRVIFEEGIAFKDHGLIIASITNIEPHHMTVDLNNATYLNWGINERNPKPQVSIKITSATRTLTGKKLKDSEYVYLTLGKVDLSTYFPYLEHIAVSFTFKCELTHNIDTIEGSHISWALYLGAYKWGGIAHCPSPGFPLEKGTTIVTGEVDKAIIKNALGWMYEVTGPDNIYLGGWVEFWGLPEYTDVGEATVTMSIDNIRYYYVCKENYDIIGYSQLSDGDCHLIPLTCTDIID